MTEKIQLAADDGVIELAGPEPIWVWAHMCPTPKCACRTALLATTSEGRDVLLERGAPIRTAWNARANYIDPAASIEGLLVFDLNIDSAVAHHPIDGRERLDLPEHPDVRAVVDRLNGDVLDSFGRLWLKGKGLPDPEHQALGVTVVVIRGWQPGDMVAWSDVFGGVRKDLDVLADRVYQASDLYCLVPACDCGEVIVRFDPRGPRGAPSPGSVTVARSGTATLEPYKNGAARLEQLWSEFRRRHPRHVERLERRSTMMKSIDAQIESTPQAVAPGRVGRNGPSARGRGNKLKRCRAAAGHPGMRGRA